ncbi:MAG: hypothetical protein AB3N16_13965 [Flavobacteriaceae bacterium]
MTRKKALWPWNLLVIVVTIGCLMVLLAHSRNWTTIKNDHFKMLSGFYYKHIMYADIDSVEMVERIPPMIRLQGFSAFSREKGIFQEFQDSLTDKKISVYVDNINHHKIKLVYNDSVKLYFNFSDSLKTGGFYQFLQEKTDIGSKNP